GREPTKIAARIVLPFASSCKSRSKSMRHEISFGCRSPGVAGRWPLRNAEAFWPSMKTLELSPGIQQSTSALLVAEPLWSAKVRDPLYCTYFSAHPRGIFRKKEVRGPSRTMRKVEV